MKNNKEYSNADTIFIQGYNQAIKEFNNKNLVIIEGDLYLLTNYQFSIATNKIDAGRFDKELFSSALDYIKTVGTFLRHSDNIYNY